MTIVSFQAVMANPTGTELQELSVLDELTGHKALFYHQEVVGKRRYFGLFYIAGNKYIYKTNNQATSS